MNEDAHSAVGYHQATMYDAGIQPKTNNASPDDRVTPTRKLSNVLNKSGSTASQCPFSAHTNGKESPN
jgi:hypothetical protein